MPYTQDEKLISIKTPLGKDVLLLTGIKGTEEISRLFGFELAMISEKHDISFDAIVGKNVTVSVVLADGSSRYFNGIVSSFSQGRGGGEKGGAPQFSFYRATLVPWFWLLTQTSDMRIFQNKSAPDIIDKVFKDQGFKDYRLKLQGSYAKRDYCVQYRETDFNFVSRLMEEEGIHYFFEHEDGKHIMVIGDAPSGHKPCLGQKSASYHLSGEGLLEEDIITSLEMSKQIRVGKYSLSDYNFEIPNTDLTTVVPSNTKLGPGEREIYDYPGLYGKKSDGDRLAKIRMEEEEAQITKILGGSSCRAFTSGYKFTLTDHFRRDLNNKDYLLVSVTHEAVDGYSADVEPTYRNSFECIPHDVPFRPLRITPKPFVKGAQTAIVVGPSGEEIYPDKHGRVKVQFHWDREGKNDDKSSCWIRVSQAWAGGGWGAMSIPRIKQEVIVDFLEGDPDRPIITGRVYHGANPPPYALPGDKTKSTIKSDSSMGGGGFNEIRFEDKKGSEEIFLHGQKDWTIAILNDKNQTVGHDETLAVTNNRTKDVGVDQSETIGSNKKIKVGANHTESIGANKDLKVGANHTEAIGANMSITVGSNKTETVTINTAETIGVAKELTIGGLYQVSVGAAMNETIGAAKAEEIGAAKSVNVGASSSENIGVNKSVNAGSNISASAGSNVSTSAGSNISEKAGESFAVDAGKDVLANAGKKMMLASGDDFGISGGKKGSIEIADELTIKCGDATITMNSKGDIIIDGKNISINGSGNLVMKASKISGN
ncbi:MAG: type VI secretion system tip protein TssI/VgrG [Pedobacter sp.]